MKIQNLQNNYSNKNFKAREYALIKTTLEGVKQNFTVYSVNNKDTGFLDIMASNIVLKKLTQGEGFSNKILTSWKNIINNSIMMAGFDEPQQTYLLVKGNRPCSIISYKDMFNSYLDGVASWPVNVNKYVKLAGTSMFKLLFYNAEKNGIKNIFLDCARNSPIDLERYYGMLGFENNISTNPFISDKFISRSKFLEVSKKLDSIISVEEIKAPKNVNLRDIMDVSYLSLNNQPKTIQR